MNAAEPLSVFDRLSADILGLREVVVRRSVIAGQTVALVIMAWQMLRRMDARLQSVVARYRKGKLITRVRKSERPKPQCPKPAGAEKDPKPALPKRLPRGLGWFAKLIRPDLFAFADTVRMNLDDPEMVALSEAGPQAGRIVRSMCQMLGIHPPQHFARPKLPRPSRAKPKDPEKEAAREAKKAQIAAGKKMRWRDIVPPGHTFPRTPEGWAEWLRRAKRSKRRRS